MNADATKKPAGKRTFDFASAITTSVPVPADAKSRAPAANAHPFPEVYFSPKLSEALEGKQPHLFVPVAYWTDARDVAAEKVTVAFQKDKLRALFNVWVKKDEATRSKVALITMARTGKEGIEGINEPGISMWMTKA